MISRWSHEAISICVAMIPLTLRVAYRGGAITCYPGYTAPPGFGIPDVLEQVGVVMEVQFVTEGGAFDEQFDTGTQTNGGVDQSGTPSGHVSQLIPMAGWSTLS